MRAIIALCHRDMEGRFERCLPPEHRVRARRDDGADIVELIVEGAMLPEVVDDYFQAAVIYFTAREVAGCLHLEACWHIYRRTDVGIDATPPWLIGQWPDYAGMMDFLR